MNSKPSLSDYIVHAAYLPIYGLVKYIPSPIGDILRKMVLKLVGARIGPGTRIYEGNSLGPADQTWNTGTLMNGIFKRFWICKYWRRCQYWSPRIYINHRFKIFKIVL